MDGYWVDILELIDLLITMVVSCSVVRRVSLSKVLYICLRISYHRQRPTCLPPLLTPPNQYPSYSPSHLPPVPHPITYLLPPRLPLTLPITPFTALPGATSRLTPCTWPSASTSPSHSPQLSVTLTVVQMRRSLHGVCTSAAALHSRPSADDVCAHEWMCR